MTPEQLPEIMSVNDVKNYLKIGSSKAYALCRRKDFPALKLGKLYRIPKNSFLRWIEQTAGDQNGKINIFNT